MIAMSLNEIATAVGGIVVDATGSEIVDGSVEFDSRAIKPGDLFLAIPGARVDGHDFAQQARKRGAQAVMGLRPTGVPTVVVPHIGPADSNSYATEHDQDGSVSSVLAALATLAHHLITRLDQLTVIGVTGSAGKTSTKDIIASIARLAGETVAPPGSFNNEIGHPYTALRCTESTRYLVAELSARGLGHIAHLAQVAPPQIGVVLNIGSAHMGEFGSKEIIARAKGELVEALDPQGVAVLNADDPLVMQMRQRTSARILTFSTKKPADLWASDISLDKLSRARFTLHYGGENAVIHLNIFGAHQVSNALAAAAAAVGAGIAFADIVAGLNSHQGTSANRMDVNIRPTDNLVVINDSYNANPESMRSGIDAAITMRTHRVIAVLGAMGELGDEALAAHREIIDYAVNQGIDIVIAVGQDPAAATIYSHALTRGVESYQEMTPDAAAARVEDICHESDVVFIKASHALGLWEVADRLLPHNRITIEDNQEST
ncbi:UDP-N-acetylmuramoyl-tripeptide--D-alanyl-D-alanine ligase [Corynebacterium sp. ES2775-CONJ]|uniref:UDP-N-acetylmuramoyl-tripeptide--D-alanyl-D- alanine ligase n=1 Tax=Corynebacterium sp. ES2775-CONJ TaxID=2974029 RepID=UPI00216A0AA3|nr:UDP-N-acetylmuramoyl-tripeptide--D-alanyl-D-alanine ligase [Corynebacterium sp. ES2775-CONJ]MCS4489011.1 UDP-N-acetylmuramoyl-tripeptide--D-alanyl-D-alanine ligase [Corynebacterium sp. ES2775-CONJ]